MLSQAGSVWGVAGRLNALALFCLLVLARAPQVAGKVAQQKEQQGAQAGAAPQAPVTTPFARASVHRSVGEATPAAGDVRRWRPARLI